MTRTKPRNEPSPGATSAALRGAVEDWAHSRAVCFTYRDQGVSVCTRLVELLGDERAGELATGDPEALIALVVGGNPPTRSTLAAYRAHIVSFQRFLGGGGPRREGHLSVEVTIPCGDTYVVVRHLPERLTEKHVRQIAHGLRLWIRS